MTAVAGNGELRGGQKGGGGKGSVISHPAEVVIDDVVDLRQDYYTIRGTSKAI